jgi:DNA-binding IclR family transcriptional regulator
MMTIASGIRLVPKGDRRASLLWHVAEGWSRAFGTRATAAEVARRWQIDQSTCEQLLGELTDRHVLRAHPEGSFELTRPA